MTSLELFRSEQPKPAVPPYWGTGKLEPDGGSDLWIPRPPTWQTTGFPLEHHYTLTDLKLSNVRDNDELVPRAQSIDISKNFINKSFPSEHPYASHIEKFAMIPKFDSPQDPKRGVAARSQQPISEEMPANAYHSTIVKKIKGFPYREEIQALPSEGKKEALYWQGEDYFDQQSKIHGNRQQFYPIPPKQTAPNLQDRPAEMQISERSQNVLRNIERSQWIPSQKLDYTGLGPSNPLALDNLDSKRVTFLQTGLPDDKLYPCSINTFDPARPMEGHLRKLFAPKPTPQKMVESGLSTNPDYRRKMTLTEREEDRLLNGKEYLNFPEDPQDPCKDKRWQELDRSFRPEPNLERLNNVQLEQDEFELLEKQDSDGFSYLTNQKEEMHKNIQNMEAQNRWRVLESGTPSRDVAQIKEKYKMLKDKEMPSTFYLHEGKYNEERAGMYKTSYDPQRLAFSMSKNQMSGGDLFNTSRSHSEASRYQTVVWDENEAALDGSNTVVFKNNTLSGDRPSTADMLDPYRETVALQRYRLQPSVLTARPKVMEGGFVLREDTFGDSYNTTKFLQDNKLDKNIRIEPTNLISHENQNLERVREKCALRQPSKKLSKLKSVHFSDDVQISNINQNIPVSTAQFLRANDFGHSKNEPEKPKGELVYIGDVRNLQMNLQKPVAVPTVVTRNSMPILKSPAVTFSRDSQLKPPPLSETVDEFRSLSTNFMPSGLQNETSVQSSYSKQFPVYNLSEKKDSRFFWEPGSGHPRPQSSLMEMQNRFIKSEVRKSFHYRYPETNPEIRMNINTGKKHSFFGMNAQVIHG